MKASGIAIHNRAEKEHRNGAENHLPGREHGGRELDPAGFDKDVRESRRCASHTNPTPAQNRDHAAKIEQSSANERDSTNRDQRTEKLLQPQWFIGKHPVREKHPENWNRCLENSRETRRDVEFSPENRRVIQGKHQNTADREREIIRGSRRPQAGPSNGERKQNQNRDEKADADEGNW